MNSEPESFYEFGPFRLDKTRRLLLREGQPLPLTPKAIETLIVLVENGGHVVDKRELIERIWPGTFVEEGTLVQNIFTLRKALGDRGNGKVYIETVPRRGYCFVADVARSFDDPTPLGEQVERCRIAIPQERDLATIGFPGESQASLTIQSGSSLLRRRIKSPSMSLLHVRSAKTKT